MSKVERVEGGGRWKVKISWDRSYRFLSLRCRIGSIRVGPFLSVRFGSPFLSVRFGSPFGSIRFPVRFGSVRFGSNRSDNGRIQTSQSLPTDFTIAPPKTSDIL